MMSISFALFNLCLAPMAAPAMPPLEQDSSDPKLVKIVLLAGKPAKGKKPGEHENFAGSVLLYKMLKQTPGVHPVLVQDGWPKNEAIFSGTKCIVLYTEGAGLQEYMPAERWAILKKTLDAGAGIVHLHTAIDYPAKQGMEMSAYTGGFWDKSISCRGHWDTEVKNFPDHPTCRGVKSFTLNDGWLFNPHLLPDTKGIVTIAQDIAPDKLRSTADAKKHLGRSEILGWTYEDGKKRAFTFTGGHEQKNWKLEGLRKLVVNGILWSAGLEIPKDGAVVALNEAELMDFVGYGSN